MYVCTFIRVRACVRACVYYMCKYMCVLMEEGLWTGTREYVYVNICGICLQFVAHVLQRDGPERGRRSVCACVYIYWRKVVGEGEGEENVHTCCMLHVLYW